MVLRALTSSCKKVLVTLGNRVDADETIMAYVESLNRWINELDRRGLTRELNG